jgi:hypothetical protein
VPTHTDFPADRVDAPQHGPTPIVAGSWHSDEAQSRVRRKRLARVGKSLAVIVDRELLEVLGFDRVTQLELRAETGRLVVVECARAVREQEAPIGEFTGAAVAAHRADC